MKFLRESPVTGLLAAVSDAVKSVGGGAVAGGGSVAERVFSTIAAVADGASTAGGAAVDAASRAPGAVSSTVGSVASVVPVRSDVLLDHVTAASGALARAGQAFGPNLDWTAVDPVKYMRAGTRGFLRSPEEACRVWETIPESIRAVGQEHTLEVLDGFDWSHVVPRSAGGSDAAANGVFELASLNRSRGARVMTPAELDAAAAALRSEAFKTVLGTAAKGAARGAAVAAVVTAVVALLDDGLEYRRGAIDVRELMRRVIQASAVAAAAGGAVVGVMTAVAASFPAVAVAAAPVLICFSIVGAAASVWRYRGLPAAWWAELRPDARRFAGRIRAGVALRPRSSS